MKDLKFLFFAFLCCFLIQCDDQNASSGNSTGNDTPVPPPPPPTQQSAISLEQASSQGETIQLDDVNQMVQTATTGDEAWSSSPVMVIVNSLKKNWDAQKHTIQLESENGESFNNIKALVTSDDHPDDNAWDKVMISNLAKADGVWQVQKAINVNKAVLQSKSEAINLEAIEQKGQTMSISDFNQEVVLALAQNVSWVKSPLHIALKFVEADMETRKKDISIEKTGANQATVIIEDDGYLDDSIRGGIVVLRMTKSDNLWQIKKASQAWRCWQQRGHQDYSTAPCS